MKEIPQESSFASLVAMEERVQRNLEVMHDTVNNSGGNLFTARLERANLLDGPDKTAEIITIGLQREMICGIYQDIRIPHAEEHLKQLRQDLRGEALRQAEGLNTLLGKGFIDKAAYDSGIGAIAQYLEEGRTLVFTGHKIEGDEDYERKSQLFREKISELKLRGKTAVLVMELTKAVSPETMYPTQALQLAVLPVINDRGERRNLSPYINHAKLAIEPTGLTIETVRAAQRSGYYMTYISNEQVDKEISGSVDDQSFVEKIQLDEFTEVTSRFVIEVIDAINRESAKPRSEILKGMYPGEDIADRHIDRLNVMLSRVRDTLKQWGIYVHVVRGENGDPGYYISETPRKDRKDKYREHNMSVTPRRGKVYRQTDVSPIQLSEKETSRLLIEERVRSVTMGSMGTDLLSD